MGVFSWYVTFVELQHRHELHGGDSERFQIGNFVDETEIFPIWLCPIKGTDTPQLLSPHFGGERFINIGLYGMPRSSLSVPQLAAKLEKEIVLFGGRKMLYSFTYYERDIFSKIYDEARYLSIREKFFAEGTFPHIYNKIVMC